MAGNDQLTRSERAMGTARRWAYILWGERLYIEILGLQGENGDEQINWVVDEVLARFGHVKKAKKINK